MDWANERYVRLYTRDTFTWKAIGWQGRAVLPLLMRKLDRCGVMELDNHPIEIIVSTMIDLPPEVVKPGLEALIHYGVVEMGVDNTCLLMPNFLEAQEATQTDAHRSREYRARMRDTKRDASVTKRDETVTTRHTASHGVTPSRTVPNQRRDMADEETPPDELAEEFASKIRPIFPRRNGDHRWKAALSYYRAARRRGVDLAEMLSGTERYAAWCAHEGITGQRTVKQAASFFGTEECWKEPWDIIPKTNGVPTGDWSKEPRIYVTLSGQKVRIAPQQKIHWNTPEEVSQGATDGYQFPNGSICLSPGGRFEHA